MTAFADASCGPDRGALLVANATLFTGRDSEVIPMAALLVCGDRIMAVGALADMEIPAGARIIDARGGLLMPGLINAHMHGAHDPATRREQFLLQGVTTVCDAGSPLEAMAVLARDRDGQGRISARAVFSGPMITVRGGYPATMHDQGYGLEVSGPDQARQTVRMLAEQGAGVIKIGFEPGHDSAAPWPMLDRDEVRAVVAEAHGLGLPVRCHVQDVSGLVQALDAGLSATDSIEHVPARGLLKGRDPFVGERGSREPGQEYQVLLRRMRDQGITLTPTLSAGVRGVWDNSPLLSVVGQYQAMGGRVALGTDHPFQGVGPGLPRQELELLIKAGLSPLQALAAGTANAARICGLEGETGVLAPGLAADFIILAAEPGDLDDPARMFEALQGLKLVVRGGEVVWE